MFQAVFVQKWFKAKLCGQGNQTWTSSTSSPRQSVSCLTCLCCNHTDGGLRRRLSHPVGSERAYSVSLYRTCGRTVDSEAHEHLSGQRVLLRSVAAAAQPRGAAGEQDHEPIQQLQRPGFSQGESTRLRARTGPRGSSHVD